MWQIVYTRHQTRRIITFHSTNRLLLLHDYAYIYNNRAAARRRRRERDDEWFNDTIKGHSLFGDGQKNLTLLSFLITINVGKLSFV